MFSRDRSCGFCYLDFLYFTNIESPLLFSMVTELCSRSTTDKYLNLILLQSKFFPAASS